MPFLVKTAKKLRRLFPSHVLVHTQWFHFLHNFTYFVKQETGVSVAGDYGNSCWYVVTVYEAKKAIGNSSIQNTSFPQSFFAVSNTLLATMQINYSRDR
jgi:hypothetical protein